MRIKTKLRIITGSSIIAILIFCAVTIFSARQIREISREISTADQIVEEIVGLRALTYDYVLYRTERTRIEWWAAYDEIGRLLAPSLFKREAQPELLNGVIDKHETVGEMFLQVVRSFETRGKERISQDEPENRLIARLLLISREMVSDVFKLAQLSDQKAIAVQQRANGLNMVILLFLFCTIAMNAFFVARALFRSVIKLQEGIGIVAAGKLDHRVGTGSKDEIGQLSEAFDKMTESLEKLTVSRDELAGEVTERKQTEKRLKETMAELERSNKELEHFAYVASHDLQEPLRAVASFVQLLERRYKGRLDSDADQFIFYAVDGARRMQSLIEDLLAYSRVDRRGNPLEAVNMEAVLEQMIGGLQTAMEERAGMISHDPLPIVSADSTQMVQLLQNLIGNALKFRGEDTPKIHVSAEPLDDEWLFSVRDNGIGIDGEFYERIFKIFQRLHTRTDYPGTGIGLAICKKIVERHGGRIWVESEPGNGSIFYFTIPRSEVGVL